MRPVLKLLLCTALLLATIILAWAHWPRSEDSILQPLQAMRADFNLKSTRADLGSQPILLIVDMKDTNVYSRYVGEILKTEGILCFETVDASSIAVDSSLLSKYKMAITAVSSSSIEASATQFSRYVQSGGSLLMMAPSAVFDSLLGIRDLGMGISNGYMLVDSSATIGSGLSHAPLQFFGSARLCEAIRSNVAAWLSPDRSFTAPHVAVSLAVYGKGRAGCFTYDLGKSVVHTRQGPPPVGTARAVDKDGDRVFRMADLYYDSFDYANRSIPQADEQQKLLVKVVFLMLEGKMVLPRVWYFPHESPAVALITGDHHGWISQTAMPTVSAWLDSANGRFSFFVYPDAIDTRLVHDLILRGHAVNPHFYYPSNTNRSMRLRLFVEHWFSPTSFFRPRLSDLASEIDRGSAEFAKLKVGNGEANRFHYLIWWGWTETPQLLAQKGIGLDLSISGIDPHYAERQNIVNHWNSPIGYGYVNGSGLPMKVISKNGEIINLFCQLTQFEDDVVARECLVSPPNDSVTTRRLINLSERFIEESINDYHAVLVWNFHPEHTIQRWPPEAPTTGPWIKATVRYLKERNIPMLSVNQWQKFLEARRAIRFERIVYAPSTHSGGFRALCPTSVEGVTFAVPVEMDGTPFVKILSNGICAHLHSSIQVLNGQSCLMFQVDFSAGEPIDISYSIR